MMNDDVLFSIKNLKAWYLREKLVLEHMDIDLYKNECVGLIGLNGAGKTTFIKIIAGLHHLYDFEEIQWCGESVNFRSNTFKIDRYVSFADEYSFSYLTFHEYLKYVFKSYRKQCPDISDLIQGFHFQDYTNTLMKELSTGNKKKAALIIGFALQPKLLLLDEPVNGLDFDSTEFLYKLMIEYKKYGTILFSSHILESICITSDRVLILKDGHIQQEFKGEEITGDNIREELNDI